MFRPSRPLLVIVGGMDQLYRGPNVEQAAARYSIALIDSRLPTWQHHLVVDHELADTRDPAAVVAAGLALADRHTIGGVLTWDEYALVPASVLASRLGLPSSTATAMHAARNKAHSRQQFAEHSVPSARAIRVHTLAQAGKAAQHIGFPVVLKPVSHAASIGVIRVNDAHELPGAWQFTSSGADAQGPEGHGALVEEYLDGPEISVECATIDGATTPLAVTRKQIGMEPYFEETGHTVTANDPLLPRVAPAASAAVRALGITHGIQHVEMRLTSEGPRIIEVNARIGGDMISTLVRLAIGLDLTQIAADVACYRQPQLIPTTSRSAGITIFYPSATGVLATRALAIEPGPQHPWLHQLTWQREVGNQLTLPPRGDLDTARVGFAIVTADDRQTVHDRLARLADALTLTIMTSSSQDDYVPATASAPLFVQATASVL